jgi:hypothetical protein
MNIPWKKAFNATDIALVSVGIANIAGLICEKNLNLNKLRSMP